jgi:TRAP-type C4-dicarboxylate transport system permease large subunit
MLPPSHNMIIYSISAGGRLSIADLFTAGIHARSSFWPCR